MLVQHAGTPSRRTGLKATFAAFLRDALHVAEVGLRATDDAAIARHARAEGRAVLTENVADFADQEDLVLVVMLKKNFPGGGAQAAALANVLDHWIETNPAPYVGNHWPK